MMVSRKKIFVLMGHPDRDSLTAHLAEQYIAAARVAGHEVRQARIGELQFDPILRRGYKAVQELEPDLVKVQERIQWCGHLVIFYPSWWSSMPALLKGMFERVWLPKFAFRFHPSGWWWDGLLKGRSATVFVLSDSPPVFARLLFGDSTNEIKRGILWFSGFSPITVKKIGPLKNVSPKQVVRLERRFLRWGSRAF